MNEARNYIIRILNDQYTLCSDESEDHINKSSELVNLFIREIVDRNKQMEHKKVAVLAALRMASYILHLESQVNESKSKELAMIASLNSMDKQLSVVE
jgi:cell division protein ZapA (FtsZ GTPase activity inhibitor)